VELRREPGEKAPIGAYQGGFLRIHEVQVNGRRTRTFACAERALEQRAHCLGLVDVLGDQQAPPGRGRERHHTDELRVVTDACARGRLGPAEVEHVLAVAVLLQVERQRCHQPRTLTHEHVDRLPARASADAAAALEREQKRVLHERVIGTDERIPFL
jgi:hypothetical protein